MSEAKDEEAELVAQVDNTRGIPTAKFIEDIPAFIAKSGIEPEEVLKDMQQIYGKYKFMESQLVSQKKALVTKVPDIGNALKALEYLMSKMESGDALDTKFEVSDAIYASAEIKPQNKVMLWLGANVMLEYNYEDAHKLLSTNLRNAKINLKGLNKDLVEIFVLALRPHTRTFTASRTQDHHHTHFGRRSFSRTKSLSAR
jgi:prefoldin subunit 5